MLRYLIINEQQFHKKRDSEFDLLKAMVKDNRDFFLKKKYIVFPDIFSADKFKLLASYLNAELIYEVDKDMMVDFLEDFICNLPGGTKVYFEGPNKVGKSFYLRILESKQYPVIRNSNSKVLGPELNHLLRVLEYSLYIDRNISSLILYDRSSLSSLIYSENIIDSFLEDLAFLNRYILTPDRYFILFLPKCRVKDDEKFNLYEKFYKTARMTGKVFLVDFYCIDKMIAENSFFK